MNLADQIVPVWRNMLRTLDGLLAKAADDPRGDEWLRARLVEDMHPLSTQVRFLCNMPGEGMERLTGLGFTSSEEDPETLVEARERIATTLADLQKWGERDFRADGAAIELALPNAMTFDLTAGEYVRDWALPQFYFHTSVAYAILRQHGLALGKADFVPHMFQYLRGAPA